MAEHPRLQDRDHDERVAIPLDPVEALRALLKVDPESETVEPRRPPEPGPPPADA